MSDVQDEVPPVGAKIGGERGSKDVETLPSYVVEQVDIDYKALLLSFKDRALFVDGVRKEALSRTRPHNWLSRKAKNGTVTFSLMGPGAERVRTVAPVGFVNKTRREESWNKEFGPGYTIIYEADVYVGSIKTGLLPVIGTCSSDDDFFSLEHVELPYNEENPEHKAALESEEGRLSADKKTLYIRRRIPASEVTKENIEKSALMNLIVNGVSRVLGIRQLSEEELKEVGIDVSKIPGIDYGSRRDASGRMAPALEQKRDEIKRMLIEMQNGSEPDALADLKRRTAFNDYQGCPSWDRMTEKQINMHHERVKADYDKTRGDSGGAKTPAAGAPAGGGKGAAKKEPEKPSGDQPPAQGGQRTLI